MAVVQNLYEIFKLPASMVADNDCIISNYTISQGRKDGNYVSIGDNLVFQQIRYIHGDFRSHKIVFNEVTKYRRNMREYKKQGEHKLARIENNLITKALFVKDVVNIFVDRKKSDFNKIRTKGFTFNGVHYTYLCSGSGQIRRNTATFINSDIYKQVYDNLNVGLLEKTAEYSPAKYSAYFALAFSSVLWVRTPRVCVIKDFFRLLKNQPVDFIVRDPDNEEARIEKRIMDLELNAADGQGLIDPRFSELWANDMGLSYTPCSFVVRSCFIKGNLVPFDFKEYAHLNGITQIYDKWGQPHDIDSIDVLLSESQFKTSKYYNSWEDYQNYAQKARIHWGVSRYNKKYDDEYVLSNYQYIQSLDLTKDDIQQLITPTIDWINKICLGDPTYSLLYMFGAKNEETAGFLPIYSAAQTNATKAVVKNVEFLKDTYVQRKIYRNITETINRAKIGKVWIRGNYQFCISDPLAQCQAALGLNPVGCVPADHVYAKWWNDRGVSGTIDVCRSPMIDLHEHNPNTLYQNDPDADYWFQHIYSGIIYSTYDTGTARQEDSDFDGDIVLTTNNPYFIKGSHKDHNIITYEKGNYAPKKINISNVTAAVAKGFGTSVGSFSNTATCMYAMAAIFDKPEQDSQRSEIMNRIKLLREIVGQEIDRIKGADKPSLPSTWKKFAKIEPDDDDTEKAQKYRRNSLVISKKPYFFRYLYKDLNQTFKQFEDAYNTTSRSMFGMKFKKLLKKENKTPDEINLVRKFQKYNPLITSNCIMNTLCREIESIDFDIQFAKDENDVKRPSVSMLPTFESKYAAAFDDAKYKLVSDAYKTYTNNRSLKAASDSFKSAANDIPGLTDLDDTKDVYFSLLESLIQHIQDDLFEKINYEEFLFYCSRLAQKKSNFNWAFAWEVLDTAIISLIPYGQSLCPVHDNSPEAVEFLGSTYSLKDVSHEQLQRIVDKDELGLETIAEVEGKETSLQPHQQLIKITYKEV